PPSLSFLSPSPPPPPPLPPSPTRRSSDLTQRFGLLEHADVHVRVLALGEAGQLDRAREPGRPRAHHEHVQVHPVARARVRDRAEIGRAPGLTPGTRTTRMASSA